MRIHVDRDTCEGLGMCEAMADDYFGLDDDDVMHLKRNDVDEADRGRVHAATQACPVLALKLA